MIQLDIPTTELDLEQVRSVLDNMKELQKLDAKWNRETWRLLTLSFNSNLKELTVRVKPLVHDFGEHDVDLDQFVVPIYAWVKEWMSNGFVPQNINFVTSDFDCQSVNEMLRSWSILNCNSPPGHHGFLRFYYNKKYLDLFPNIPEIQIEFGQTAVLPIAKISDFGVLGLDGDVPWVFLTSCMYGGETWYKAACMESGDEVIKFVSPPSLNYVVDFDLSDCSHLRLLSCHLEQVAIACPNLRRLNLRSNSWCLTSLQGLQSIATYCNNLQGLNLLDIFEVEDKVQFWNILSCMRLTHLAVDLYVTEPSTADEKEKMINLYQKLITLIAIELHSGIWYWDSSEDNERSVLIAHVPFLESCYMLRIEPIGMQSVFNACKKLKYLTCLHASGEMLLTANCYNLQEPCFHSITQIDIPETFMTTVSAHGGLVHVLLDVNSVTSKGITSLIMNSPNLLTFHIYVKCIEGLDQENLQLTFKETFHKKNCLLWEVTN